MHTVLPLFLDCDRCPRRYLSINKTLSPERNPVSKGSCGEFVFCWVEEHRYRNTSHRTQGKATSEQLRSCAGLFGPLRLCVENLRLTGDLRAWGPTTKLPVDTWHPLSLSLSLSLSSRYTHTHTNTHKQTHTHTHAQYNDMLYNNKN